MIRMLSFVSLFFALSINTNLSAQLIQNEDSLYFLSEQQKFNASMIDSMQQVYAQISSLPIPELLDLIEEIVNQVDQFSQDYELNNQTLTWSSWIHKYWWMPPMVVIAFLIMMLRYKKISQNIPQG